RRKTNCADHHEMDIARFSSCVRLSPPASSTLEAAAVALLREFRSLVSPRVCASVTNSALLRLLLLTAVACLPRVVYVRLKTSKSSPALPPSRRGFFFGWRRHLASIFVRMK